MGWTREDGSWVVDWTNLTVASVGCTELVRCKCPGASTFRVALFVVTCVCVLANVPKTSKIFHIENCNKFHRFISSLEYVDVVNGTHWHSVCSSNG